MGSQRVGHDWATELNWTEQYISLSSIEIPENNNENLIEEKYKDNCQKLLEKEQSVAEMGRGGRRCGS